ncbi:MAG: sensor histidine kinase [Bacteriovoracia bacterium]
MVTFVAIGVAMFVHSTLLLVFSLAYLGPMLLFSRKLTKKRLAKRKIYFMATILAYFTIVVCVTGALSSPFVLLFVVYAQIAASFYNGRRAWFWLGLAGVGLTIVFATGVSGMDLRDYPRLADNERSTLSLIIAMLVALSVSLRTNIFRKFLTKTYDQIADQHAKLAAQARMATLGEMASGIAHEINNPLSIIMVKLDLLKSSAQKGVLTPDQLTDNLDRLQATTDRISRIVKGLRAFSRDSRQDPFEPTQIRAVVQECLDLCGEKIKLLGVDLRVKCETDSEFESRPGQIMQVLMNLLVNSFDAVENLPDRWVEIEARDLGGWLELRVTDSGKGIPAEVAQKMMQPFYTTKEAGRGTGLGLAISRALVENHRGEITLDEKHPHTRFVIRLPKHQPLTQKKSPRTELSLFT